MTLKEGRGGNKRLVVGGLGVMMLSEAMACSDDEVTGADRSAVAAAAAAAAAVADRDAARGSASTCAALCLRCLRAFLRPHELHKSTLLLDRANKNRSEHWTLKNKKKRNREKGRKEKKRRLTCHGSDATAACLCVRTRSKPCRCPQQAHLHSDTDPIRSADRRGFDQFCRSPYCRCRCDCRWRCFRHLHPACV